jgi:ADP-ribose pyrophosphatase YjhB (NUDIX family)
MEGPFVIQRGAVPSTVPQLRRRMASVAADFPAWAAQFIVDGTRAEVLMVAQTTDGRVWLQRKGVWRLPTGTLQPGEGARACLAREAAEEFGWPVPLIRPLGVLRLEMDAPGVDGAFLSHLFLLDAGDREPRTADNAEGIDGWRAMPPGRLYAEAARLRALPPADEPQGWRLPFWGAFRALEHELVADFLAGKAPPGEGRVDVARETRRDTA